MRKRIHRALAGLLIAALFGGVATPLSANEMVCEMDRPVPTSEPACGACGPAPEPGGGPSFVAASCCRFQAPGEARTLPVLLSSPLRTLPGLDAHAISPAIASDFAQIAAASGSESPAAGTSAPRSSPTHYSILRL